MNPIAAKNLWIAMQINEIFVFYQAIVERLLFL
jgi:hypothetical protein